MRLLKAMMGICAVGLGACAVTPSAPSSPPPSASPPPPASTASTAPLAGTRWTGVVEGTQDARTLPRLEFTPQGRIVGFTGCNLLNGVWSIVGGEIKFGPMVTTKRGCMGPEGDVERRVLQALGEKSRVVREGPKLILVGPEGSRFEFVEAAAS